jgi:hypothetical protein
MTSVHAYRVGDLVQTEYNDGPGAGSVYGLITAAGPKQCSVTWESGRRQILHGTRWHHVKRVPDDTREDALHATRHARAALLAKLTTKKLRNMSREAYASISYAAARQEKP